MAAEAGAAKARVGSLVAAWVAVAALGLARAADVGPGSPPEPLLAEAAAPLPADPSALRALASRVRQAGGTIEEPVAETAPPLPGSEWNDPDSVNWADVPEAERGPLRERLMERRGDRGAPPAGRLLERLRSELRSAAGGNRDGEAARPDGAAETPSARWPDPPRLVDQLTGLAGASEDVGPWAATTLEHLRAVQATAGPADPAAMEALLPLGDDVDAGMALADRVGDAARASEVRRAALAVSRRVAVWRAATTSCATRDGVRDVAAAFTADASASSTCRLLASLERFESSPAAAAAGDVHAALEALRAAAEMPASAMDRAVGDHYLAPNLRIAVHQAFVARLLPEATVNAGPMQDFVLGRPVRGTRRVEQSTGVRFVPDPDEIRVDLLVDGVVTSKTVTESGPVAVHSRATAEFTVRKPLTLSASGLAFGFAVGTASNQSQLADIRTSYDSLPIMGPLMRSIARNQHDEHHAEATREVNDKIITRACREVDTHTEPKFRDLAERVRKRAWEPLVALGLEPTAVALETTADTAAARIRLAGAGQLAAHTPRPRAPTDALLSVQVHESSVNNACARFGFAGQRLTVEELVRTVCGRLGVPPRIPDDLPTDVEVAFTSEEPLRVECRDGLVQVRMSLDAIESGRRAWYDIVANVAYRPVIAGPQVFLEREGPVRLSGAGQQGRMEIALRTIFGKIFPKERPVPLLPEALAGDRRLAGVRAVQAVCTDGWLALALAEPAQAGGQPAPPTAAKPAAPARRVTRR